ncbi:hypothetical protein BKA66DRAFT_416675 [Pyrenochaeta sp. MPI-SDFR-AT-0127]|nr:hypothetical protein BKA66DRAFT_416675 [Pyrenochaeta sp. MPI-SDFR-AT-0127]
MTATLLQLPRELRDLIYRFYILDEGGYIYNPATRKFKNANGRLIDLALSLTCRQVATEMRGLALELNTLTFKTWTPDTETERISNARFAETIQWLDMHRNRSLIYAAPCYTSETFDAVAHSYPQYLPLLEIYNNDMWRGSLLNRSETPSIYRAFVTSTLETLSEHPFFVFCAEKALSLGTSRKWDAPSIEEYLAINFQPWKKPSDEEIAKVLLLLGLDTTSPRDEYRGYNVRYSAAAMASRYLCNLSFQTRRKIRHIVLHEDKDSSAQPECHGQALILFCQENPHLRIERRVDLWNNMCRAALHYRGFTRVYVNALLSCDVSRAVALWVMEAEALATHGMPANAFTLVLDGSADAAKSSLMFEIVRRDCAWQEAFDICSKRGDIATPSWAERRKHRCFIHEGLPRIVEQIIKGQSLVRCNFEVGEMWDTERVIEENRTLDIPSWDDKWLQHNPRSFDPPWKVAE